MKQAHQVRLTAAQMRAIRRKKEQGRTPREIEEDKGINHVTVWRHTKNTRVKTEESPREANKNGQNSITTPSNPVPGSTAPFSDGYPQSIPANYQYTTASIRFPTRIVQTSFRTLN